MSSAIVYQARLHWILFIMPAIVVLIATYIAVNYSAWLLFALLMALVGLAWAGMIWLNYQYSYLTIKPKHLILRSGLWMRKTVDIPLNKIESVDIRQHVLGTLLQYGSIVITGAGGSKQMMKHVSKPLTCRRHIEQLMHE